MSEPWAPPAFRPTIYKGIKMRSRLEAATAASLDRHSLVEWKYEPWAYASVEGQYLPDFWIKTPWGAVLLEMKGAPNLAKTGQHQRLMEIALESDPDLMLVLAMRTHVGNHVSIKCSGGDWVPSIWQDDDIGSYFCAGCQECVDAFVEANDL